jgi:hypothetical protein
MPDKKRMKGIAAGPVPDLIRELAPTGLWLVSVGAPSWRDLGDENTGFPIKAFGNDRIPMYPPYLFWLRHGRTGTKHLLSPCCWTDQFLACSELFPTLGRGNKNCTLRPAEGERVVLRCCFMQKWCRRIVYERRFCATHCVRKTNRKQVRKIERAKGGFLIQRRGRRPS